MFSFENLTVYQDAVRLGNEIYKVTQTWPKSELFGLTNQLRRATVSISLNIAEGSGRTKKDFRHFLDMSRSSCQECIPLIEIAKAQNFILQEEFNSLYDRYSTLAKKISALKRSINP